ncbi:MAG: YfiR family protein [Acidobacteria bacterium]|nr:YfiR family protein [Acidobacteriota bacterium]MBI2016648.1 YfiR family protein [Candidatus Rokubacteria bacterium]
MVVCAALLAAPSGSPSAQPEPPPLFDQEVKASFVYTVAKFVDWPEEAFGAPAAPMVFAILGDDLIGDALQRVVEGKSVNGHPVTVVRAASLDNLAGCHVLFLGRSESPRLREILRHLQGANVLTVSEAERFALDGGVMGLTLDQNMVRFEVNVDAASRSRLAISSKILKLGKVIRDRKRAQGAP